MTSLVDVVATGPRRWLVAGAGELAVQPDVLLLDRLRLRDSPGSVAVSLADLGWFAVAADLLDGGALDPPLGEGELEECRTAVADLRRSMVEQFQRTLDEHLARARRYQLTLPVEELLEQAELALPDARHELRGHLPPIDAAEAADVAAIREEVRGQTERVRQMVEACLVDGDLEAARALATHTQALPSIIDRPALVPRPPSLPSSEAPFSIARRISVAPAAVPFPGARPVGEDGAALLDAMTPVCEHADEVHRRLDVVLGGTGASRSDGLPSLARAGGATPSFLSDPRQVRVSGVDEARPEFTLEAAGHRVTMGLPDILRVLVAEAAPALSLTRLLGPRLPAAACLPTWTHQDPTVDVAWTFDVAGRPVDLAVSPRLLYAVRGRTDLADVVLMALLGAPGDRASRVTTHDLETVLSASETRVRVAATIAASVKGEAVRVLTEAITVDANQWTVRELVDLAELDVADVGAAAEVLARAGLARSDDDDWVLDLGLIGISDAATLRSELAER
jgi:hypothetical protein